MSTVIPTYRRAAMLRDRSLPSVLAQTVSDWECLVIGDGTDDESADVVAGFADPRLRFINIGRPQYPAEPLARWRVAGAAAFNHGLGLACGRWVSYLGDDDCYRPRHHEVLLARSASADVVRGLSQGAGTVYGGQASHDPYDIVQGSYIMRRSRVRPAATAAATESWDAMWWRDALARGLRFVKVDEVVHEYHPAPESAIHHGGTPW